MVERIHDPVVKTFWTREFPGYHTRLQSEAISPIQNKVGQFLTTPLIRNMVGQVRTRIDFRKLMDDWKILICNLSKGRIGEENSSLLGALFRDLLYKIAYPDIRKSLDQIFHQDLDGISLRMLLVPGPTTYITQLESGEIEEFQLSRRLDSWMTMKHRCVRNGGNLAAFMGASI